MNREITWVRDLPARRANSRRCRKDGCGLDLAGAPNPFLLLDLDEIDNPQHASGSGKCDYEFLGGRDDASVAPIELKRGAPRASQIVSQLRSGARLAQDFVEHGAEVRFVPIAAYGGQARSIEVRKSRRKQNAIRFRQQTELVRLVRCGGTLQAALLKGAG